MRTVCFLFLTMVSGIIWVEPCRAGAIDGNRYRVIVSTDIGGGDEDDIQSMIHYLVYSDLFDTEGLISSPPKQGRTRDIFKVIDIYVKDYPKLMTYSTRYPAPEYLRSITKQGAIEPAGEKGYGKSTEGSRWIIECAKKDDKRPLYILVWGSITDVAQALHDEPSIKEKIRVHFIASWNQRQDENSFRYIDRHHSDLWLIHNNTTFRGWYMGGSNKGDLGNKSFVTTHINGHGALGDYFAPLKGGSIKMGDTPTVAWLLYGTPEDPTRESWGGQFVKKPGRPNWWIDDPAPKLTESGKPGARTVNKWRVDYLRHFQKRMDRCKKRRQQHPHRGFAEVSLKTGGKIINPYRDVKIEVVFERPDRSKVVVDGFYDGQSTFRARAYCDTIGRWRWRSSSSIADLDKKSGAFEVKASPLKGKLRLHKKDPRQFAYDNDQWFLHIGDTGYRYVTQTEPKWKEYIDQAAKMGATKIRTWFCQGRSDVQVLFSKERRELNLAYWQEIDKRLRYAFEKHPHIIFELIPYGEDTEELRRYGRDNEGAKLIARYAQARFSALPNIYWCISNDREIVSGGKLTGRKILQDTINKIGNDMAAREPWGTLITNHQSRFKGYDFTDAAWSDIITLEDMDQVDGTIFKEYYSKRAVPMVLDEDRYEHWRNPKHDRYFFRRLMWASLLSGGSATYGGLKTYESYDGDLLGVQGYFDSVALGKLEHGADDFIHIHKFFRDSRLTLVNMKPNDAILGDGPGKSKCISDNTTFIVYMANPDNPKPGEANVSRTRANVTVRLPEGEFAVKWFNPRNGQWTDSRSVSGGKQRLTSPAEGDWIVLLKLEHSPGSKGPLRIHPENPRYFTDDSGKAVFLTGSHTWANFQERGVEGETPNFDYEQHLDFMQTMNHNFMRMWRWEHAQWMQFVPSETLIRYKPMAYIRTGPGKAVDGKSKFNLTQFNQTYFDRLRRRVVAAGKRGIYVSVMLFQGFSVEQKGTKGVDPKKGNAWDGHPYNLKNNINGINGDINEDGEGDETHTLKSKEIISLQESYVRKVIDTLNDLDNVLWEISNESHTGSIKWHYHMIRIIKEYEATKPKQHPVGMTSSPINNPPLFASPADWISPNGKNYLNDPPDTKGRKVIIVDNDHINPWNSDPEWVWKNFMRGNHFILMDNYKDFRIGSPEKPEPGHDPTRRAMGLARKLSERIDLVSMTPQNELASTGYCLANLGREYLVYQPEGGHKIFTLILEPGKYSVEWINPANVKNLKSQDHHSKTGKNIFVPMFNGSAILYLQKILN